MHSPSSGGSSGDGDESADVIGLVQGNGGSGDGGSRDNDHDEELDDVQYGNATNSNTDYRSDRECMYVGM